MRILVLHGPNLNLLGEREPEVYGTLTLAEVDARIRAAAQERGVDVRSEQSNLEGELVGHLQEARTWADGVILNPGGYSHTSVAIRDAVAAIPLPVVEVHLSNLAAREEFRSRSIVAGACVGTIAGFGWPGYVLALDALRGLVSDRPR
ncbi:MAG TPA: type II 3-dehydroquinate dehydratase [Actinomycetota bacterium]|nr:type II 3-dehydroquinate dehydratase [Actinomycetota bacterium]